MSELYNATADSIKNLVDGGFKVFAENISYQVIKNSKNQYLIRCSLNGHCIGLTWNDDITLSARHFFIEA